MKDTKVAYPVLIKKTDDVYYVEIPDFGISTQGLSIVNAIEMARDTIGRMGMDYQDDKKELPQPYLIKYNASEFDIETLVDIDFSDYRKRLENKMVKKNCTIPYWLNKQAERKGINFSKELQEVLIEKMNYVLEVEDINPEFRNIDKNSMDYINACQEIDEYIKKMEKDSDYKRHRVKNVAYHTELNVSFNNIDDEDINKLLIKVAEDNDFTDLFFNIKKQHLKIYFTSNSIAENNRMRKKYLKELKNNYEGSYTFNYFLKMRYTKKSKIFMKETYL